MSFDPSNLPRYQMIQVGRKFHKSSLNSESAKENNLNFHPLKVSRYCDPVS